MNILKIVPSIVEGVFGYAKKRQERKVLQQSAEAKYKLAKLNGDQQLDMTDAEWEAWNAKNADSSWKDEYVTVIMTIWIPVLLLGCIYAAWKDDPSIVEGIKSFLSILSEVDDDIWDLTKTVVFAAVGLKLWRGR